MTTNRKRKSYVIISIQYITKKDWGRVFKVKFYENIPSYCRCQLLLHVSHCLEKAVECPVKGCTQMFKRKQWEVHMRTCALSHAKQTDGEIQWLRQVIYKKVNDCFILLLPSTPNISLCRFVDYGKEFH